MSDLLPATDGLFLGSDSRRWNAKLLSAYLQHLLLKSDATPALSVRTPGDDGYVAVFCGDINASVYRAIRYDSGFYTLFDNWAYFELASWGGSGYTTCAKLYSQGAGGGERFEISRAGDISLLDDRFIQIGKDSDGSLPTPSATYRGKMIRLEGGSGEADKLYVCMKSASDAHSWVQVASG